MDCQDTDIDADPAAPSSDVFIPNQSWHRTGVWMNEYLGYTESLEQAEQVIQEYEISTGSKFILSYKRIAFGKNLDSPEIYKVNHKILWCLNDATKKSAPWCPNVMIPFDGVPFIIAGKKVLECRHGNDKGVRAKMRWKKQAEERQKQDPEFKTRAPRLVPSKKVGCKLQISITHVIRFPQFEIQSNTTHYKRRTSDNVKIAIKGLAHLTEAQHRYYVAEARHRYYVALSAPNKHIGHPLKDMTLSRKAYTLSQENEPKKRRSKKDATLSNSAYVSNIDVENETDVASSLENDSKEENQADHPMTDIQGSSLSVPSLEHTAVRHDPGLQNVSPGQPGLQNVSPGPLDQWATSFRKHLQQESSNQDEAINQLALKSSNQDEATRITSNHKKPNSTYNVKHQHVTELNQETSNDQETIEHKTLSQRHLHETTSATRLRCDLPVSATSSLCDTPTSVTSPTCDNPSISTSLSCDTPSVSATIPSCNIPCIFSNTNTMCSEISTSVTSSTDDTATACQTRCENETNVLVASSGPSSSPAVRCTQVLEKLIHATLMVENTEKLTQLEEKAQLLLSELDSPSVAGEIVVRTETHYQQQNMPPVLPQSDGKTRNTVMSSSLTSGVNCSLAKSGTETHQQQNMTPVLPQSDNRTRNTVMYSSPLTRGVNSSLAKPGTSMGQSDNSTRNTAVALLSSGVYPSLPKPGTSMGQLSNNTRNTVLASLSSGMARFGHTTRNTVLASLSSGMTKPGTSMGRKRKLTGDAIDSLDDHVGSFMKSDVPMPGGTPPSIIYTYSPIQHMSPKVVSEDSANISPQYSNICVKYV